MPKPDTKHELGIQLGTVFDTLMATYCIALDIPDSKGEFAGIDPNGDITRYDVRMVDYIHMSEYPLIEL